MWVLFNCVVGTITAICQVFLSSPPPPVLLRKFDAFIKIYIYSGVIFSFLFSFSWLVALILLFLLFTFSVYFILGKAKLKKWALHLQNKVISFMVVLNEGEFIPQSEPTKNNNSSHPDELSPCFTESCCARGTRLSATGFTSELYAIIRIRWPMECPWGIELDSAFHERPV